MGDFNENQATQKLSLKTWAKLLPFMKPLRWRILFVVIMMVFSAVVDSIVPLFTQYAVNHFVVPRTADGIVPFTLVYVGVILFQALTTVLYSRQSMVIEMHMGRTMKRECFIHLQKLPISFYNTTSVGYILARVMSDTNRISGMIAWVGATFLWYIFYLIGMLTAMFVISWRLALIAVSVVPVVAAVAYFFMPKLLSANREMRRINSQITSSFNENINGAKTSKTLVIEDRNCGEFKDITSGMRTASLRASRLNAVFTPIITFFGSMAVALVLAGSGTMVMNGALDFGILSAFIAYAVALLDPLTHIGAFFSEIIAAQVNIERVSTLLSHPCDISDRPEVEEVYGDTFDPKPENWTKIRGDIDFEDIWFRYPDAAEDDYVLKEVNLHVPAGSTVAIVGETGAGKSTMVNLACRFFEPTKGRILIDGVDYRERSQLWLHSNLGYVQQSPHLFSGTLRDNLRYGKLDASDDEILAAAKLVSVDKIAEKLESGFDTGVGEGGDRLSTGEKQLVSFGRAIIADPPIFVLDEATSSIDTETERLIQDAITHVLEGRTSFIIAHRLSTIRNADTIILVEGHGISEMGSHDELMAQKGRYHRLYTAMMIKDESEQEGFTLP